MSEEGKKFSFAFSKSIKKTNLQKPPKPEEKKVEYIECVDENAIKIIGGEKNNDGPMVIPCVDKNDLYYKNLENTINARLAKEKSEPEIKQEKVNDNGMESNGNIDTSSGRQQMEVDSVVKKEPDEPSTLDKQAVQEILEDLKSDKEKINKQVNILTIPTSDDVCRKESTLEDREKVPIEGFGMAMLRGMGWTPETDRTIEIKIPECRPKGMGLGADKLLNKKTNLSFKEEKLKWTKGSMVKVIAGKNNGSYGKVEGIDGDSERIFVRLELGGDIISVNPVWVQLVTSEEYSRDSRLLNSKKIKENNGEMTKDKKRSTKHPSNAGNQKAEERKRIYSSDDDIEEDRSRRKNSESSNVRKNRERKHQSSEDNSSSDRKSNKKRDYSSTSPERRKQRRKNQSSDDNSSVDKKTKRERSNSIEVISERRNPKRRHRSSDDSSSVDRKSRKKRGNSAYSSERREKKKSKKKRHQSSEDDSSSGRKSKTNRDRSKSNSNDEKKERKKSRKDKYQSPDNKSCTDKKSSRQRDSGDEDCIERKSKKSMKHKSRDSSSERMNLKKGKDYEKSNRKKSDYSDSSKSKRRTRSRSKSKSSSRSCRRARSRSYSPRR